MQTYADVWCREILGVLHKDAPEALRKLWLKAQQGVCVRERY
jgi:hypothetical protein